MESGDKENEVCYRRSKVTENHKRVYLKTVVIISNRLEIEENTKLLVILYFLNELNL